MPIEVIILVLHTSCFLVTHELGPAAAAVVVVVVV